MVSAILIGGDALLRAVLALHDAKLAESAAREARISAEVEVIRLTRFARGEGQQAFEGRGEASRCVVSCSQPINVSVDAEAWRSIRAKLPARHLARDVMVESYKLDKKVAAQLKASNLPLWLKVSECVTSKPGKVSVSIKKLEKGGESILNGKPEEEATDGD